MRSPPRLDPAGRRHGDDVELGSAQAPPGIAVDRFVGIVAIGGAGSPPGRARRTARDCRCGRRYGRWRAPRRARRRARSRGRARSRCSTSSRDSPGLRLGLSRHCSVVSTVPLPSLVDGAALEHPVGFRVGQAGRRGEPLADVLVALELVFPAPAVEAETGGAALPCPCRPRSGPYRAARCRRTARRSLWRTGRARARPPPHRRAPRPANLLRPCRRRAPPPRKPRPRARPPSSRPATARDRSESRSTPPHAAPIREAGVWVIGAA